MATVTISAGSLIANVTGHTAPILRIFATADWVTQAGVSIPKSNPDKLIYVKQVTCSVAGGIASYPEFTLDSTTDAAYNPKDVKYLINLYSNDGLTFIKTIAKRIRIPATPTPTTLDDLIDYNNSSAPAPTPGTVFARVDTDSDPNANEIAVFADPTSIKGMTEAEFKAAFNIGDDVNYEDHPPIFFAFGDATPKILLTLDTEKIVKSVILVVLTAFNGVGATARIGIDAEPGLLIPTAAHDLSEIGSYETYPMETLPAGTQIKAFISSLGSTTGQGMVLFEYA